MNLAVIAAITAAIAIITAPEIVTFAKRRFARAPAAIDRSRWVNDLFSLAAQAAGAGEPAVAEAAKALIAALVNVEVKK
jgi:hypothetical protein